MRVGRVGRMPFAVDDDDGDLAFALAERIPAGVKMGAERRRRLYQLRVMHPDLAGAPGRATGLDQKTIALLLLRRHLVIGDLGVAAKGWRIGHFRTPRRVMRSAARQRVDLRAKRRRWLRAPAFAEIGAGPDLTAVCGARHSRRLALVEGELEHRVRDVVADIDPVPAVAAVAAVQQGASVALETRPRRHPEMARIAGNLADIAAIDVTLRIERFQWHVPPVVAAIGAVEHA